MTTEDSVQEDSSSDDDNASKKVKSFRYGKVAFYKVYKGPERYFPGQEWQYEFETPEVDGETNAVL